MWHRACHCCRIFVADREFKQVQSHCPTGERIADWERPGKNPRQSLAPKEAGLDPSANVQVGEHGIYRGRKPRGSANHVSRWGASGGPGCAGPGEFNWPPGLMIELPGSVVIADWGNDRIQRVCDTSDPVSQWDGKATVLGVADNYRNVWLLFGGKDLGTCILRLPGANAFPQKPHGRKLSAPGMHTGKGVNEFTTPRGMATYFGMAVYVTEFGNNRTHKSRRFAGDPAHRLTGSGCRVQRPFWHPDWVDLNLSHVCVQT